jgi:hypothetical protein
MLQKCSVRIRDKGQVAAGCHQACGQQSKPNACADHAKIVFLISKPNLFISDNNKENKAIENK